MPGVPPKQTEIAWDEIRNHSSEAVLALPLFHSILVTVNRIEDTAEQLLWLIAPFVVRNPLP